MNPSGLAELFLLIQASVARSADKSRLIGSKLIAYADELGISAEASLARKRHRPGPITASPEDIALVSEMIMCVEASVRLAKDAKLHPTCPSCFERRIRSNGSSPYSVDEGVLCRRCAKVYDATGSHEDGVAFGVKVAIHVLPKWNGDMSLVEYLKTCRHNHSDYLEHLDPHLVPDESSQEIRNIESLAYFVGIRETVDLAILTQICENDYLELRGNS